MDTLLRTYGVTRRTLERDFEMLSEVGYRIESAPDEESTKSRKRIASAQSRKFPPCSADELAAARIAVSLMARTADPATTAALESLTDRIEQSQDRATRVDADALYKSRAILFSPTPKAEAKAGIVQAINDAILRRRQIIVTYRPMGRGQSKEYEAEPYGILVGKRNYLVWRGTSDRKWRRFSLPYIEKVTITEKKVDIDTAFSIANLADLSLVANAEKPMKVELSVAATAATRFREYQLPPDAQVRPARDGSLGVRFTSASIQDVCQFVFSWGRDVEIKKPQSLRQIYRERLRDCLEETTAQQR